jgi:biopolymer transport protein ExbB
VQPLLDTIASLRAFLDQGGIMMYVIALLTLVMWTLIFERFSYFKGDLQSDVQEYFVAWEARRERKSWHAHQIRTAMISRVNNRINSNLDMITALVALCPLLGLLGTVTGMIEVFSVLSTSSGGDTRSMASGVSKATIPTMAGMVSAITGLFANTYLARLADDEKVLFADHLTMDH